MYKPNFRIENFQIDAADKQLKTTRKFLEDQATERELERDEFTKELEKYDFILKEKDKVFTSRKNDYIEVTLSIQIIIINIIASSPSLILFIILP